MIKQIDHIAIAVEDLEKAKDFFVQVLGARKVWSAPMPGAGFRWTTLEWGSSCMIELLNVEDDCSENGPGMVQRFLSQRGQGAHHITIQVDDLAALKAALEQRGVAHFGYGEPMPGWKEMFVHPRGAFGILLQFAQFEPFQWLPEGKPVPPLYQNQAPADRRAPVQLERTEAGTKIRCGSQELTLGDEQLADLRLALSELA